MRVPGMRVLTVALVVALSARANDHAPAKAEHAKPAEPRKPAPQAKAAEHGMSEAKKTEDKSEGVKKAAHTGKKSKEKMQ